MSKIRNLLGHRFGNLVVIGEAGTKRMRSGSTRAMWLCRCDCGSKTLKRSLELTQGKTKSCGCLKRRHGHSGNAHKRIKASPTYNSWRAMIVRCTKPNTDSFARYGGSDITVCDRWQKFENFLADMGERPDGMTLDRIDNEKGYGPHNCRWATHEVQMANRSTTHWLTYNGTRYPLMALARLAGISEQLLRWRLNAGWDIVKAVETPPRKKSTCKTSS